MDEVTARLSALPSFEGNRRAQLSAAGAGTRRLRRLVDGWIPGIQACYAGLGGYTRRLRRLVVALVCYACSHDLSSTRRLRRLVDRLACFACSWIRTLPFGSGPGPRPSASVMIMVFLVIFGRRCVIGLWSEAGEVGQLIGHFRVLRARPHAKCTLKSVHFWDARRPFWSPRFRALRAWNRRDAARLASMR